MTIKEVKSDLIDHLSEIDKKKLNMVDLKTYCEIVQIVDEMYKPSQAELWKDVMSNIGNTGFGSSYRPVEMKED